MSPRIVTNFEYPPIPDRRFDWRAYYDDDNGEPGLPNGWGRTEAVVDLIVEYPRPDVDCPERGR